MTVPGAQALARRIAEERELTQAINDAHDALTQAATAIAAALEALDRKRTHP